MFSNGKLTLIWFIHDSASITFALLSFVCFGCFLGELWFKPLSCTRFYTVESHPKIAERRTAQYNFACFLPFSVYSIGSYDCGWMNAVLFFWACMNAMQKCYESKWNEIMVCETRILISAYWKCSDNIDSSLFTAHAFHMNTTIFQNTW